MGGAGGPRPVRRARRLPRRLSRPQQSCRAYCRQVTMTVSVRSALLPFRPAAVPPVGSGDPVTKVAACRTGPTVAAPLQLAPALRATAPGSQLALTCLAEFPGTEMLAVLVTTAPSFAALTVLSARSAVPSDPSATFPSLTALLAIFCVFMELLWSFGDVTAPSTIFCVLTELLWSFAPVTAPSLMSLVPIVAAAQATPLTDTNSAISEMTSAGDGRNRLAVLMAFPSSLGPRPLSPRATERQHPLIGSAAGQATRGPESDLRQHTPTRIRSDKWRWERAAGTRRRRAASSCPGPPWGRRSAPW